MADEQLMLLTDVTLLRVLRDTNPASTENKQRVIPDQPENDEDKDKATRLNLEHINE